MRPRCVWWPCSLTRHRALGGPGGFVWRQCARDIRIEPIGGSGGIALGLKVAAAFSWMLRCPEQAEHTPWPTGRRAGEIRDSIVRVVPQQPRSRHSTDRVRGLRVEISWCRRERAARRRGYKRRPGPAGWPRSPAHNWTELRSARRVLSVLPDRRRKRRQMRMFASWRKPGTETANWSPRVTKSGANAMRCETAALSTADSSTGSARFRHQPLIH